MFKLFFTNQQESARENSLDRFSVLTKSEGIRFHNHSTEKKAPLYQPSVEEFLPNREKPKSQRDQRSLAFQLIYGLDRANFEVSLDELINGFMIDYGVIIDKETFAYKVVDGVLKDYDSIMTKAQKYVTNWDFDRLSCTVKLLLLMSIWEIDILKQPGQIVIDEYVELSKAYGEADSYRIINGVLDNFIKKD